MTLRITSVHNPRIREAAQLRERDGRDAQQRFLIDGSREIARALAAGIELVELFVCEESLRPESRRVLERAVERGMQPCYVSPAVQSRLAFGQRDEGLVACARQSECSLSQLELPAEPLIAVLAGVEKPGNVGAVIRSADAAGVSAVIIADGGTDLFNPNTIRASLGTIFALPLAAASGDEVRRWLQAHQFQIFAARVGGPKLYTEATFIGRIALVVGSEASGLDAAWSGSDVTPLALPMLGVGDSLNVSVTAGVLFYEALRQRRLRGST